MSAVKHLLFMGTSGLVLPYKNQRAYPKTFEGQSRLRVYGSLLNSIEVNSIFYKLPKPSTITQWAASVGGDFKFTFKLWKEITHNKGLEFRHSDIEAFFQVVAGAVNCKGCVLIQFPASVRRPLFANLAILLEAIREANTLHFPLAVEFRHTSWYDERVYELLNDFDAALVYHDKSGSVAPQTELDANHIYLRFHGPDGNYRGSYDQGLLYEYAGYIAEWLNAGKSVYVYFNNTMGAALENLRTLEAFLTEDYSINCFSSDSTLR